jgi:hypothetical protein
MKMCKDMGISELKGKSVCKWCVHHVCGHIENTKEYPLVCVLEAYDLRHDYTAGLCFFNDEFPDKARCAKLNPEGKCDKYLEAHPSESERVNEIIGDHGLGK